MAQPVKPPQLWTKEEVRNWITWCSLEYELTLNDSQLDTFQMNGKALLMLRREDFRQRAPAGGDVIFNALQKLTSEYEALVFPSSLVPLPVTSSLMSVVPINEQRNNTNTSFPCLPRFYEQDARNSLPMKRCFGSGQYGDAAADDTMTSLTEYGVLTEVKPRYLVSAPQDELIDNMTSISLKKEPTDKTDLPLDDVMRLPLKKRGLKALVSDDQDGDDSTSGESSTTPEMTCTSDDVDLPPADVRRRDSTDADNAATGKDSLSAHNKLLWEFIAELLEEPTRELPVRWLDQSTLTFRISDPGQLAEMWGEQKRKENMTYEKLSRALRYYYKMNIISKVPGKKLTYRYLTPPPNIVKGVRGAKPGVPHKRRKNKAPTGQQVDSGVEALDLSMKRRRTSDVRQRRRKAARRPSSADSGYPSQSASPEVTNAPRDRPTSGELASPEVGRHLHDVDPDAELQCLDLSVRGGKADGCPSGEDLCLPADNNNAGQTINRLPDADADDTISSNDWHTAERTSLLSCSRVDIKPMTNCKAAAL